MILRSPCQKMQVSKKPEFRAEFKLPLGKSIDFILQGSFRFAEKTEEKKSPHIFPQPSAPVPPTHISHWSDTFSTTTTQYCYLSTKSPILHEGSHFLMYVALSFNKCVMACMHYAVSYRVAFHLNFPAPHPFLPWPMSQDPRLYCLCKFIK